MRVASVAESFATYRAGVLPAAASDVQVLECRRAFYAGVYYLLMGSLFALGDESTPEDDAIAQLEALKAECEAFGVAGGVPLPPPANEPPMMAAQRIMREAEQAAGPLPSDIHHEAPEDLVHEIRPVLERIGHQVGDDLPAGWGFALFLFTLGVGGHTFYIANCDRGDVVTALHEFIRRQVS